MDKRCYKATEYLHEGRYVDESADPDKKNCYAERIHADPYYRTRLEGITGLIKDQKADNHWEVVSGEVRETVRSRRVALAPQQIEKKRATSAIRRMSANRLRELASISPAIANHIANILRRAA